MTQIVFIQLLNDSSGSSVVLTQAISSFIGKGEVVLYVGAHGSGALDAAPVQKRFYWYRRSRYRVLTLFNWLYSQLHLMKALNEDGLIDKSAIIYVNTLLPFGAMIWAKVTRRNLIVHVHEMDVRPASLKWLLCRLAGVCANHIMFVSAYQRHDLRIPTLSWDILPNPVVFGPNAHDDPDVRTPRSEFVVLMLCSLREFKGIPEYIALVRHFRYNESLRFELVLNEEDEIVEAFAAQFSDLSNLKIYGRALDPRRFYRTASLVVNLSRVDQCVESFGLTLIEGMSFGLPVIGPPVGGPTEIVTHGFDGFLIDSRKTDLLAQTIMMLVNNRDQYDLMAKNARATAAKYSVNAFENAVRRIVERITVLD